MRQPKPKTWVHRIAWTLVAVFWLLAVSASFAADEEPSAPAPVRAQYVRQIIIEAQEFSFDPLKEYQLGEEAAEEIQQSVKLINDDARRQKLIQMVNLLKPYSPRPQVDYQVFLVEDPEVNAFALPGGFFFVYTGLLEYAKSDDELAGVLAHEMAHNCLYHGLRQLKKAQQTQEMITWAELAMILAGGNTNPADIITAGSLVLQGVMNGYSQEYEFQADALGTDILARAPRYNPPGLMAFSERMAHDDVLQGKNFEPNLGVFATHPDMPARVMQMYQQLREMGIQVKRRAIYNPLEAKVRPALVKGQHVAEVVIGERALYATYVAGDDAEGAPDPELSMARAQELAANLNKALVEYDIQLADLSVGRVGEAWGIYAINKALLAVSTSEAELAGLTEQALAEKVVKQLQGLIWQERLSRAY